MITSVSSLHLHCFQSQFLFSRILLFLFYLAPAPCSLFVFFCLDRERFRLSCHTCDWLRDGWYSGKSSALFKAHSGTEAPRHLPLYLSRTAPCSRHPVLLRIFSHRFSFSMQPRCGHSSICWGFTLVWHYLSSCCASVYCRQSIIV